MALSGPAVETLAYLFTTPAILKFDYPPQTVIQSTHPEEKNEEPKLLAFL